MTEGLTESERYLIQLCQRSFLRPWAHPNVFMRKGGVKEVADVIVAIGRDVVVFSDKSCEFPNTGDLNIDWRRWYRKSVASSIKQLQGAVRTLEAGNIPLFSDRACTVPAPIKIERESRIHLVAVAKNSSARGTAHFNHVKAGLTLHSGSYDPEGADSFSVGHDYRGKSFVHVFDEIALDALLGELDTISDFCNYLTKKESLFRNTKVIAASEQDLLGWYLKNVDSDGRRGFDHDPNESAVTVFQPDLWDHVRTNPVYLAKKHADEVSYEWDRLIEFFAQHANISIGHPFRTMLEHMTREHRLGRRIVAGALVGGAQQIDRDGGTLRRQVISPTNPDVIYQFILLANPYPSKEDEYRAVRKNHLSECVRIAASALKPGQVIVGIARAQASVRTNYDFQILERNWLTDEEIAQIQSDQRANGFLTRVVKHSSTVHDYPEVRHVHSDPSCAFAKEGDLYVGSARMNRKQRRRSKSKGFRPF